jgi:hypothetical protein
VPAPTLDDLRTQARYHRDRFALYRARAMSSRPTSPVRMREYERAADRAEERLLAATRKARAAEHPAGD